MANGGERPELGHADTVATPAAVDTPGLGGQPGVAAVAATELEEVDRRRYQVASELARGGMGRILHAIDRRHGRAVAIKELLADTPALRARFRREALITARLQHPAIVPVYEAGTWPGGEPFYAMKMVEGRSLDRVIEERPALEQRIGLLPNVIAVAEAIAYAHGQRVIHRDLKPSNVLVGDFGETVVIDWGLAKDLAADVHADGADAADPGLAPAAGAATGIVAVDEVPQGVPAGAHGLTVAGHAMGTPAYMAPEQARGEPVDERADVYALGGILYHLLTGRMPYADSRTQGSALLRKVLDQAPTPVAEVEAKAPPDLVAVVAKAMARRPEDRYPTAAELVDDLRRFETGQLVSVRDYTAAELLRRWLRRHRLVVGFAAVLLLVVAVGGTIAVTRVVRARDRAEAEQARAEQAQADAEAQAAIARQERQAAETARERADQARRDAEDSRNQAQASAQALVESWVNSRFAPEIRTCWLRGSRGQRDPVTNGVLRLVVDGQRRVTDASVVEPFATAADACMLERSRTWSFPPGTRAGDYSLILAVDAVSHDVQVGFEAYDAHWVNEAIRRRYTDGLLRCYDRQRETEPNAVIKVDVGFIIATDGTVRTTTVAGLKGAMAECMQREIAHWRFPAPRDPHRAPTEARFDTSFTFSPPEPPPQQRKPVPPTGPDVDDLLDKRKAQAPIPDLRTPQIGGALDRDVIRKVVQRFRAQLQDCYAAQLAKHPDLEGTANISYTIAADGSVSSVSVTGLGNQAAEACMTRVIERMQFPRPMGNGPVKTNLPMVFRPVQ